MIRLLGAFAKRGLGLSTLAGLAVWQQTALARAQNIVGGQTYDRTVVEKVQGDPLTFEQRAKISYESYILGPGDTLQIELLDLPELSGNFSIGPDGSLYLPRLRSLYVEGLTIQELQVFLEDQFRSYILNPNVYIRPIAYRPIRVYIGGEVKRPGYYTLSASSRLTEAAESIKLKNKTASNLSRKEYSGKENAGTSASTFGNVFPTVFDAIQIAQGITPYSDLGQVQVTRKRAEGVGGGRIRTNLNFLSLITEGNESQNIRLFDGDVISIGRSSVVLREQILKAGQTNLTPQFIEVFVTGRVNEPGTIVLPQGGSLNQAIILAGGTKFFKGKVEFVRFNRNGTIDRRIFSFRPDAATDAPNNPVLAAGDIIRIKQSILSGGIEVVNEVSSPFIGVYSLYTLFNGLSQ